MDDIWLATLDINALYTNIPQDEAYRIVMSALKGRDDLSKLHLTFLDEMVKFVLFQNYFLFEGQLYHQRTGVAMGATCAPSVANLLMGSFEKTWLDRSEHRHQVKLWCRYIDDIFVI